MNHRTIASEGQQKFRYVVEVSGFTSTLRAEFIDWMVEEHAADMLGIDGCLECRVVDLEGSGLSCEYIFRSKEALQTYLEGKAMELRAKGIRRFGEGTLTFSRRLQAILYES